METVSIITETFGGSRGNTFPLEGIKSIGLNGMQFIDALVLNGVQHGGDGGAIGGEFQLEGDEYIADVTIRHGTLVDGLSFHTNKNRNISRLGDGGTESTLNNIRVLGLGGKSAQFLNQIIIKYIDNYTPSVHVELGNAIISIIAPGGSIERFTSSSVQTVSGHKKIMSQVFTGTVGVETTALGEFIAKLTASVGITRTTTEEINDEVTTIESNSAKTTFTSGPDRVGLEVVPVEVFVDTETNFFWMWPLGMATILSFEEDADRINTNAYDLTTLLAVQMPNLLPRREQRNGFNFYRMD